MKQKVLEAIKSVISKDIVLERPKDKKLGHYATPVAFSLAKELKKSPKIIAEDLVKELETISIFDKVVATNGFINIFLSDSFLDDYSSQIILNEDNFAKGTSKNQNILLEYVSANPTGPLHIGHARGAVIGDAIVNIGKHLGYNVVSEYYVNDAGNQIKLLGVSLNLAYRAEILKEEVIYPEEYYKGEYIIDLAKEIFQDEGASIYEEISFDKLCEIGKSKMLDLIIDNLKSAGITFDNFISEKELYSNWNSIKDKLENNNALYTKDEKIWLKSSEHGDELDRVVVRENGIPTYLAGDIIYHDNKYNREYDRYINIWGADHHGYIARVKSAIKYLGNDEKRLDIILAQMVSLLKDGQPYKMSKRAGNFILMSDVVEDIGVDALRFIFLSKKIDTHLEFDVSELDKHDSTNPIFYINYAHARINSLVEKSNKTKEDIANIELKNLSDDSKTLIFDSLLLPTILEDAFISKSMQKVTDYLKSLSASIHSFYNANRVIGSDNEEQLLKILVLSATTLRVGLKLLGINAKDKM